MGETDHFVQFCEADDTLVHAVGGYIGSSLARGDAGVVIAARDHRAAIERALTELGLDVAELQSEGRYVALDAMETVSRVCVDDLPDPARFDAVVVGLLSRMESAGWRVRVFGEAVALLVAARRKAAAIRLEELWNEVARRHRFSLFCAYGLNAQLDGTSLALVCRQHSGVIPGESYAALDGPGERMRAIVGLQQRVAVLEDELRKRTELERAFLQRLRSVGR
jgi:hypothetical protein